MIETDRLILRPWQAPDRDAFRALNADPDVMQHFLSVMTNAESDASMARIAGWQQTHGFTFWPAIRKADGAWLGMCGLKPLTVPWPEQTDIEIGWRFAKVHWGEGYAREAAEACLVLGLTRAPRVMAMTTPGNSASWRLMRRLGMLAAPELDFDHPDVPEAHPLRRHIVYVKSA